MFVCDEIRSDVDLLLEDLESVEFSNHECLVLYQDNLCKIADKDYMVEDGTLLFESLTDWREKAFNAYQLKELLIRCGGSIHTLLFTAYDGSTHEYVQSYATNKYSAYGENTRVIVVGDKTKNRHTIENHELDIEVGRIYEDKIDKDFNRRRY